MDVTIPTLSDVVRNPRRKSIDYGLNGLRSFFVIPFRSSTAAPFLTIVGADAK